MSDQMRRQAISKPAGSPRDNIDIAGFQAYFFTQLTQGCRFWRFASLYSPLRELPGILADTLGPQQLAVVIKNNQTDIGSESIRIYHDL